MLDIGFRVLVRPHGASGNEIRIERGVPVRRELVGPGLHLRGGDETPDVLALQEIQRGRRHHSWLDPAVDFAEAIAILVREVSEPFEPRDELYLCPDLHGRSSFMKVDLAESLRGASRTVGEPPTLVMDRGAQLAKRPGSRDSLCL